MVRDTQGPVPEGRSNLRRVSLNPRHWHQARWMLSVESIILGLLGCAGLLAVYVVAPRGTGVALAGLDLTPALCWAIFALAVVAVISLLRRRFAVVFCAVVASTALAMVIIAAVAALHHRPGPLGLTAADTVLYAVLFCYHLAVGMWLFPDQIEGPAWVRRRRSHRREGSDAPSEPAL